MVTAETVAALDVELTAEERASIDEAYEPRTIVGASCAMRTDHVGWTCLM